MTWNADIKLLGRNVIAIEKGAQVAEGNTMEEIVNTLKATAEQRGVGGVFSVIDTGKYEIAVTPSFRVGVAEMPEHVFAAGIADSVNLGIYIIDPKNRWKHGDLRADSAWRCRSDVFVELLNVHTGATIDDGFLTFNPVTCKLSYSGQDTGDDQPRLYDAQFRINGQLFAPFKLRVQRPTFCYADVTYEQLTGIVGVRQVYPANYALGKAVSMHFKSDSPNNLAYLGDSTATTDRYYVATITSFPNGLSSAYFVGKPGRTAIGRPGNKLTSCVVKRAGTVYWRNIESNQWKFGTEDCATHVLDNVKIHGLTGTDAVMFDNTTPWFPADMPQTAFCVNMDLTRCGQSGNKHPIYIHLRDHPLGHKSGGNATTHFNNIWSRGNNSARSVNGVGPQGGCNLKCLSKYMTLRNSLLEQTDNWADPYNGYTSSQITSFHSHQRCIIYNNWFRAFNSTTENFGQDKLLFFQNRNMADSGHDDPPYFISDPGLPAIPPYAPRTTQFTVNVSDNMLTFNPKAQISDAVAFSSTGTLPAPLEVGKTYYLMGQTNNGSRVSLTLTQQKAIDLTDAGTGTHTVWSMGTPLQLNQGYHGANDYKNGAVDSPFWAKVREKDIADPTNEYAYYKYISYCLFDFVQLSGADQQQVCVAVADQRNAPVAPTRQFDPAMNYYSVPANHIERSQAFLLNNQYMGFVGYGVKVRRWDGETPPSIGIRYPYCVDPFKPGNDPVIVGGERDVGEAVVDVPPPEWFKL